MTENDILIYHIIWCNIVFLSILSIYPSIHQSIYYPMHELMYYLNISHLSNLSINPYIIYIPLMAVVIVLDQSHPNSSRNNCLNSFNTYICDHFYYTESSNFLTSTKDPPFSEKTHIMYVLRVLGRGWLCSPSLKLKLRRWSALYTLTPSSFTSPRYVHQRDAGDLHDLTTRVRGVSTRRWEGNEFDARPER